MGAPSFIPFGRRAIEAGGFLNKKHKLNGIRVINKTGSDIAADKLVAVIGYDTTSSLPKIVLADADVATHTDVYVTLSAITNNSEGFVYKGGLSAASLNTSSVSAAGDPVYLSTTAGAFTATAPTGEDDKVLPVGWAVVDSSTVGQIHWHIGEFEKVGEDAFQSGMTLTTPVINGAVTGTANQIKFCTTQHDATSDTTLGDIVGLTGFTLDAAGVYQFQADIAGTSTVNGGMKLGFKYTTATLTDLESTSLGYTASAVNVEHVTSTTDQASLYAETAAVIYVRIVGRITVNAAGTLALQFAQNASHADTSSVYVGSSLRLTKVS